MDGTLLDVEASFCYLGDMLCTGGGFALLSLQDVILPGESSGNNFCNHVN